MKFEITLFATFLWLVWGVAYAGSVLPWPREWWVVPAAFTVLALGAAAIMVAGMWWDGVLKRKGQR